MRAGACQCGGFSCRGTQALGCLGSSSCGTVVVAHGLIALWFTGSSQIRGEPVSPALSGEVFITEPPGKPFLKTSEKCSCPGFSLDLMHWK